MAKAQTERSVNLGRHEKNCKVCAHVNRDAIEQDFISWKSPSAITKEYGLRDRTTIYRHAHATGLSEKRRRNVRAALERIIEQAGTVDVNAASVVQAVTTYARLNSLGQFVERSERVDLNDLFGRLSKEELREYAESGKLPHWFTCVTGATGADGQES
jgi:hypothetical protein